jgi:hypothetical protein
MDGGARREPESMHASGGSWLFGSETLLADQKTAVGRIV